jgi:hypothetical protein
VALPSPRGTYPRKTPDEATRVRFEFGGRVHDKKFHSKIEIARERRVVKKK